MLPYVGPAVGQVPMAVMPPAAVMGPPAPLPSAIGPALTQPPPQAMGPPQGDAQLQENMGLWRGFLDRMQTDPNFKQAVRQVGLGMMRSPQMGQNNFDVLGGAIESGAATLDALRQRDRVQKIEEQERTREAGIQDRQVAATERSAAATERNAATNEQEAGARAKEAQAAAEHAVNALNEAIRHNKESEEIDRLRAQADNLRARAYSTAREGKDPKDVVFMNALSAKYQASGIDEVTADAMAVEYLKETKAGKAPADRVRAALDTRIRAYNSSMAALDKPLDNAMMKQWMNEEIAREAELEQILNPQTTPVGPAAGGAGSAQAPAFGVPAAPRPTSQDFLNQPNNPAPAQNPGVVPAKMPNPQAAEFVAKQMRNQVPPEQIRQRLIANGEDPALYGL